MACFCVLTSFGELKCVLFMNFDDVFQNRQK